MKRCQEKRKEDQQNGELYVRESDGVIRWRAPDGTTGMPTTDDFLRVQKTKEYSGRAQATAKGDTAKESAKIKKIVEDV